MGKLGRKQKSSHRAAQKAVKREKVSEPQTPKRFLFGITEAQEDFSSRHQEMLNEYSKIRAAQDRAISGATNRMKVMDDKVIYFLARQVFEDFDEILILCGNGLSTGALKILRGMFERTVTICYLQKHPEHIELYYKYYYVRRRKEIKAVLRDFPNSIPSERLEEYEKQFEDVKERFQVPACEVCKVEECLPCKRTRINHTWIRKDIVQMAREAGGFEPVIWIGYYVPMQESHPTAQAIERRVKFNENDKWEYVEGARPETDQNTFVVAHFLILKAIDALGDHFNLELNLKELFDAYVRIIKNHAKERKQKSQLLKSSGTVL
ncbi:MAG: DUF5677 domain-containing protein [Pyrinomonadaceae bacterium]